MSKPTTTTTVVFTVLLARDNGHDITPTALKRAMLIDDLAGLEIEHDDVIVHDITEGSITRVNEWHIAVTYVVVAEGVDCDTGAPITGDDLLDLLDEAACCCPESGWMHVHHAILAR